MEDSKKRSDIYIDNIQDFANVVGDNDNLWRLLRGKTVSLFDNKRVRLSRPCKGVKKINCTHGAIYAIDISSSIIFKVHYGENYDFLVLYTKELFVKKFNKFSPPLPYAKIAEFIRLKEEKKRGLNTGDER